MPLTADGREALVPWLQLLLTPGIGPAAVNRLLEAFEHPGNALAGDPARVRALVGDDRARALLGADAARDAAIESACLWARNEHHHLITLHDPGYPPLLRETHDPPPVLFVRGDPLSLSRPAIAIVGSRQPTRSGLLNAREFARALAAAGLTVVSGLAAGIDAAAHQGALDDGAQTVAVTGTGVDIVYPSHHQSLAEAIAASGAIVSELPLGTRAQPSNFPRRNRLIAGLTLGTLVVEAARQSGSLITAKLALEAGREVMAIPGSIHSPLSKGCHELIRQGAKLVESADDVLSELPAGMIRPREPGGRRPEQGMAVALLDPTDAGVLDCIEFAPIDLDGIVSASGLAASQVLAALTRLELGQRIERLADGRFCRCPA
jgi:DNA processing protein